MESRGRRPTKDEVHVRWRSSCNRRRLSPCFRRLTCQLYARHCSDRRCFASMVSSVPRSRPVFLLTHVYNENDGDNHNKTAGDYRLVQTSRDPHRLVASLRGNGGRGLLLCDFVPFSGFEIRVSSLRLGKTSILKIIIVDDVTLRSKLESAWHRPKSTRFLSRVSILSRDIDIANLSVCLSVRNVPISDENGLTYRHSFFFIIR